MKTIKIVLEMDVPDNATDDDINDYVDVEFCRVNSMKQDNPCIDEADVVDGEWEWIS